ncbi:MAG: hypothetical protein ABIN97_05305 [Ginsengibacter sp.]
MITTVKQLSSLLIVATFVVLASASSGLKHMTFTKEAGQIPPEFNKFKDTLLVISHSDDWGYNKYLRKNFSGNYTGHYKIINEKEIKYFPIERYRYVFDHSLNYTSKTTIGGPFNGHTSSYASSDVFYITDRKINKDYVTKSSAYYSKLMRAYIKAIDEERQK